MSEPTTEQNFERKPDCGAAHYSDVPVSQMTIRDMLAAGATEKDVDGCPGQLGHGIPAMVFDVESIGLHGDGYAVGYVVIQDGKEVESGMFACPASKASGADSDRLWVYENIPQLAPDSPDPLAVRENFWCRWMEWKAKGALLAADCAWPVEARFLAACVDASPDERRFSGPYPLVEISSVMMAVGQDPMKTHARLESEKPVHNPVADARQSARLLLEAIEVTKREWPNAPLQRRAGGNPSTTEPTP